MLWKGRLCLPREGMQAIPLQLSRKLPPGALKLNSKAVALSNGTIHTDKGELYTPKITVVAGAEAEHTLLHTPLPDFHGVYCHYFSSPPPFPVPSPPLILNGNPQSSIAYVAVPSLISPTYAPAKRHLICVTCLDDCPPQEVQVNLVSWFGTEVEKWTWLKSYRIENALVAEPRSLAGPLRLNDNLFACGDHRQSSSIHGAMASGKRAAVAVFNRLWHLS